MEESGVSGENHPPVVSHWQTLSHNVVSSTPCHTSLDYKVDYQGNNQRLQSRLPR
jgi:hypothetical protein